MRVRTCTRLGSTVLCELTCLHTVNNLRAEKFGQPGSEGCRVHVQHLFRPLDTSQLLGASKGNREVKVSPLLHSVHLPYICV